ncbi:MAG: catalase family protein [Cyanosarcina radialis HA8281-LM2]|jgi:hypothetical protein|nr:catalase family protein [Cyanosarcina radialis HA8281-LM2]
MSKTDATLELGREYPPPGEEADIQKIQEAIEQQLDRDYQQGIRPVRRDQHPKAHGCVQAEFIVDDNLPERLRYGVFKEPRTYQAWIRFSSSSAQMKPDTQKDAHGMSIKLLGVEGEKVLEEEKSETTQDFILANNQAFFVRNTADYVVFISAFSRGNLLSFFFGWNPFKWRWHEFKNLLSATQKSVSNPLQIQYWSQTPSKLGPHAIKFSAKPRSSKVDPMPAAPGSDFLQEVMAEQLKTEEVDFDFLVQLQTDPVKMPIEDATIVWDEALSPFEKVATIRIPVQSFDSPAQMEFAENLSFTPWHTLPEHQPLGNTNRVRRKVYEMVSKFRHQMNQTPRREPIEN